MEARDLKYAFLNWSCANSGIERRAYLGMSKIGQCSLRLYQEMIYGREVTTRDHLYCERGYAEEQRFLMKLAAIDGLDIAQLPLFPYAAFRARLNELIAARGGSLGPDREFSDFGGRFQGHTDGSWDGDLVEIKSVSAEKFDRIRQGNRLPSENFSQVQCYLRYGNYRRALVFYVNRDTGDLYTRTIYYQEHIGDMLYLKAATILEHVEYQQPPPCDCGRCDTDDKVIPGEREYRPAMAVAR